MTKETISSAYEEESIALQNKKVELIRQCLAADNVDLWQLREFALTRGGLVNGEMRRAAWHLLVGLDRIPSCTSCSLDENELDFIRRDANRSVLFRYPKRNHAGGTPSGESSAQFTKAQSEQLATVLSTALSGRKKLHYYQGLHDIAGVLLHNLQDTDQTCAVLQQLCRIHLRDALREDLSSCMWLLDTVLLPLLDKVDAELHDYLLDCGLECSNALLPWLITWFTHDIHDEQVASRLLDALLSSHALFPLYFAVAVLCHPQNRQIILQAECDPATVHMIIHSLLSHIVNDWEADGVGITCQELLDDAISFMRKMPPRSLLVLAGSYHDEDPRLYTQKAAYISLLKAPPSWALTANIMQLQWQEDKENTTEATKITLQCQHEKENTTEAPNTPQGQQDKEKSLMEAANMPQEVQQQDEKENAKEAPETLPQRQHDKEKDDDASIFNSSIHVNVPTVHAKCASGVPFLMSAVDDKAVLSKRLVSPPPSTRKILSRWELCRHLFFGNFASEDNCTQFPFSERVSYDGLEEVPTEDFRLES